MEMEMDGDGDGYGLDGSIPPPPTALECFSPCTIHNTYLLPSSFFFPHPALPTYSRVPAQQSLTDTIIPLISPVHSFSLLFFQLFPGELFQSFFYHFSVKQRDPLFSLAITSKKKH